MKNMLLHTLLATTVIGGAASLALAVSGSYDITRPGPNEPAPYQLVYKYKVSGSSANKASSRGPKGSEKYHMSVGDAFVGTFGVSCSGSLEASRHDRPSFFFGVFAPVGNGTVSESFLKCKYDSNRGTPQGTALDRDEFAFACQYLDDDLGGTSNAEFKKPPVAVNGIIQIERLKVKGKVKVSRDRLSGSLKFSGTGVITSGEHQGKKFKAQMKTKLRNAGSFNNR